MYCEFFLSATDDRKKLTETVFLIGAAPISPKSPSTITRAPITMHIIFL